MTSLEEESRPRFRRLKRVVSCVPDPSVVQSNDVVQPSKESTASASTLELPSEEASANANTFVLQQSEESPASASTLVRVQSRDSPASFSTTVVQQSEDQGDPTALEDSVFPACLKIEEPHCCTCLLDIEQESGVQEFLSVLDCCHPKHTFHPACIRRWADCENCCPICRKKFQKVGVYGTTGRFLRSFDVEDKVQRCHQTTTLNDSWTLGDVCRLCREVGDPSLLLRCDAMDMDRQCGYLAHVGCVGLGTFPEGDWFCPDCHAYELATRCGHCCSGHDAAAMLLCDGSNGTCNAPYHYYCVGLDRVPDGDWFCPACVQIRQRPVAPWRARPVPKRRARITASTEHVENGGEPPPVPSTPPRRKRIRLVISSSEQVERADGEGTVRRSTRISSNVQRFVAAAAVLSSAEDADVYDARARSASSSSPPKLDATAAKQHLSAPAAQLQEDAQQLQEDVLLCDLGQKKRQKRIRRQGSHSNNAKVKKVKRSKAAESQENGHRRSADPTYWNLFISENREAIAGEIDSWDDQTVLKALNQKWKDMSEDAQSPYLQRAKANEDALQKQNEEWKRKRSSAAAVPVAQLNVEALELLELAKPSESSSSTRALKQNSKKPALATSQQRRENDSAGQQKETLHHDESGRPNVSKTDKTQEKPMSPGASAASCGSVKAPVQPVAAAIASSSSSSSSSSDSSSSSASEAGSDSEGVATSRPLPCNAAPALVPAVQHGKHEAETLQPPTAPAVPVPQFRCAEAAKPTETVCTAVRQVGRQDTFIVRMRVIQYLNQIVNEHIETWRSRSSFSRSLDSAGVQSVAQHLCSQVCARYSTCLNIEAQRWNVVRFMDSELRSLSSEAIGRQPQVPLQVLSHTTNASCSAAQNDDQDTGRRPDTLKEFIHNCLVVHKSLWSVHQSAEERRVRRDCLRDRLTCQAQEKYGKFAAEEMGLQGVATADIWAKYLDMKSGRARIDAWVKKKIDEIAGRAR